MQLVAFIAIPIVVIVVASTWYFNSLQLSDREDFEDGGLETYGDQFAAEVRSAVAFGDRATASEVLGPVTSDPDIVSTTLFDANGNVLYQSGPPSPWIARAKQGVLTRQMVHGETRVSVIAPVITPEGPRGTFVLEASRVKSNSQKRRLFLTALVVALAALAFGVLVAWIVSRSFVRRLREIGKVATSADLGATVRDDRRDEIGVLARAFNHMLAQLRDDRARLVEVVHHLQTTEDELAAANAELEKRVALRTSQLEAEMKRRADMEIELRQAQRLESVGRLAAGIAHEINSPIQFVNHSCAFLDEASQHLIELVAVRREAIERVARGEITVPHLVERLRAADDHADVDDLITTIPQAIKLVLAGLERVTGIVGAMKEFASADQPSQTPSDLNCAIQNTLTVTNNEYKYVADTNLTFGELPPVTCHIGEFNQAILNIIVNAAHAIEDAHHGTGRRGCIAIATRVEGSYAAISISDDGCGIPAEIIDKIYDPFFTTKEFGRGSGQGLAIARAVIVDKHHGRLDVTSKVGVGTTFTIRLPIDGLAARAFAA